MTEEELRTLLDRLIAGWENETVEFKQASNDYDTDKIGAYFSALSNEANLRGAEAGWLVFGIHNKTRQVVGTNYRPEAERLQGLKAQMSQNTEPTMTFRAIQELAHPDGRVVLLEIPPAPDGIPVSWKGRFYARDGESLAPLSLDKLDRLRDQTLGRDWSAQTVADATLADFDPEALDAARRAFARRHPKRFTDDEVLGWPAELFTDRARLTRAGKVTRAALLLVGTPKAAWLLSPYPAQLTWGLYGTDRAYEHFGPPFLLATTALFARIRNVQLRLVQPGALMQVDVWKYDERIVLEAIHNALGHQDFRRNGRITVQEFGDRLVIANEGRFYDGEPGDYATGSRSPRRYRNPALAQAMAELGMIDRLGYGIFDMHNRQAHRFLPMPDYDLSEPDAVKLTIHGAVVDEAYTRLLMQRTDLPITDVLALDRVQKGMTIPEDMTRRLRRAKLIEGRKPHLRVAPLVANATDTRAGYIRARSLDDAHYLQLVVDYLTRFGTATRQDLDDLLEGKLGESPDDGQKSRKVTYLLTKLRRDGLVRNSGTKARPVWELAPPAPESYLQTGDETEPFK
ncbi:MAG: putative DNA binding domain-containing protein [Bifidobacteriaceae bacterium]|nr:putative DNA binding domain-containing protein [Bifidobacteriaceae bacterium]